MIKFFRGNRKSYNRLDHGAGIYFATDTQEIIHNGLVFSGNIPEELLTKIEANENQLLILNGSGEGSIQKQITTAIDQFALQITDNGTIDTFKELLDYAANHKNEVSDLVVTVNGIEQKLTTQDEKISNLETYVDNALSWDDVN